MSVHPVSVVQTTKDSAVEILDHSAFPSLDSADALDKKIEERLKDSWIEGIDEANYKLFGVVCEFNHTIAFLMEHYRALLEYGSYVKLAVREILEKNPTMKGYHFAPGMETLLPKWADLYGALVIITSHGPEFFPIIHELMAQLNISSDKYIVLSAKNSSHGEALKLKMNGLNGCNYVVASSNGMNLLSYQKAFPTRMHRISVYQADFLLEVD